jgi:hypothetical protein
MYFVALFFNRELGFLDSLQVPVMSASLLVLMSMLERVQRSINCGDGDHVPVRIYPSHGDFYRDLRKHVDAAQRTVFTSYLRRYPPDTLGESALAYFNECNAWAERSQDHHFRRVIASMGSYEPLSKWARSQEAQARKLASQGVNHRVRILPWELREADAISIAIIDDEYVFITFSDEEDHLCGFSLRSRCLVKEYFLPYYCRLWNASTASVPAARTGMARATP